MSKPYIRPMPASWWLKNRHYFWFMMREFSAVFIALYCVILLVMLAQMKTGGVSPESAFDDMLSHLQTAWSVGFHFIALLFALYHTFTWFNLVPQAMPVRLGEERVPSVLLVAPNYVLWVALSAALAWFVFEGRPQAPRAASAHIFCILVGILYAVLGIWIAYALLRKRPIPSNEPIWWSLFAAGGVVAALFVPVLIFLTGIAIPFVNAGVFPSIHMVSSGRVVALVTSLPGRMLLFLVISLSLFHWAHRFRFTLVDLGVHAVRGLVAILCYGAAIVGTALATWLLCAL